MSSKFCLTCTGILCILILLQYAVVVQCICENIPICQWSFWHEWSSCNATCGSGMKSRWRSPCCDSSKSNSFMECINDCNLSLSTYKDYQSCTACLTPPTTHKTTKTTSSTILTVLSTILQLTKALETTTIRHETTTMKAETTTKTSVITTKHPQTQAYPKTTTSKPKLTTSMNVYLPSSTDEKTTMSISKRTTTPPGTTSTKTTTPASVSQSASKAVLSGAAIAGISLGSLGVAVTVLVLIFKYSKLMKQNQVMFETLDEQPYRNNRPKRIHVK